jgi:hypothetical protein
MSRQGIFTGSSPNDGTGDSLASGAVKINANFQEIYNTFGDGNNLSPITYVNSSGISSTATYAISAGISTLTQGITGSPNVILGVVTASSFNGSGSGLTSIPAGQLTGALPAIDGSALTGIIASGTGIDIEEEGTLVGTASTINFLGIGVTATISGGIASVEITSGGSALTVKEVASQGGVTNVTVNNVSEIQFNNGAGFNVSDEGGGTAFVDLGSTFNPWYVDGQETLSATGEEPIEFVAGPGIAITTKPVASIGIGTTFSKAITITSSIPIITGVGTFSASAGTPYVVDSIDISLNNFKTTEYTIHIQNSNSIQSQKVLVMHDGTNSYSQEYAIMANPNLIVSVASTITGGVCELQLIPEIGISGLSTYTFVRTTIE